MDINKYAINQDNIIINFMKKNVTPDSTNKIHCHPYHELVIKESGFVRYTTNNEIIDVNENCVVFMPAYSIHNPFVRESEVYQRYKIQFDLAFAQKYLKDCSSLERLTDTPYIKTLSKHEFDEINLLAKSLFELKNKEELTESDLLNECLYMVLILQKCKNAVSIESEFAHNYIIEVTDYIRQNFKSKLTIKKIADKFYVSKSKLIYDFKNHCNMNILEYITITKVDFAKEFLSKGVSVAETAEKCGFSSPSYFIKVFTAVTGMTPLKFRLNEKKKQREDILD